MKLKNGLILSKVNDQYIAVAADEAGKSFNGMLKMNKTAAFIFEHLREETTVDRLTAEVCEKYDVSESVARENVENTVASLRRAGLLVE